MERFYLCLSEYRENPRNGFLIERFAKKTKDKTFRQQQGKIYSEIIDRRCVLLFLTYYFIVTAMEQFKPTDATTNPSLILAAAKEKKYAHLIDKAVHFGKKSGT